MLQQTEPGSPEQILPRITARLEANLLCRLVVTGGSMRPFLRHKLDAVFLVSAGEDIRTGDILLYLRGANTPILHRVHRRLSDGTRLMCGDAQTGLEPIRREQVLAKASHVDRRGRILPCDTPSLRLLAGLWRLLYPVRPWLLAVMEKTGYFK